MNFWATWCSPCIEELPALSKFVSAHKNVRAIGLAYEDTEVAEIKAFLAKHPVSFPIAQVDTFDPPKSLETPRGLPTTYVVAPDGTRALVSYAVVGETDAALPAPLRLPGLDPARRYRVTVVDLGVGPGVLQDAAPPWFTAGEVTLPGAVLADVGLPVPLLQPGNAVVLQVDAV